MPRLRPDLALCALFATGLLSACSTSGGGLQEIAPTSLVEAGDPELPDAVSVLPSASGVDPEIVEVETETLVASIPPQEQVVSTDVPQEQVAGTDVMPVAYSGPAPDASPMAAVLTPGARIAARSPELDALIERYADHHDIPVALLRRVVNRESTFNPAARNGPYWGLMQILPATARTMGYRGTPEGLLDAETNLIYAGKYLRGAYLVADGNHDLAVRFYARGYYFDAKRRGMLEATGLGKDRRRMKRES